ncbi:hypothetical protein PR048_026814 [Dryococelus australis]|uniref:Uncharacterized protein n=1 Tax=Dryococelus australis TaxID=614101 RepID=A0ABQ9GMC0_9NEOP|nr:hypothetical protein PR048_026814 [Dryococelus australis]
MTSVLMAQSGGRREGGRTRPVLGDMTDYCTYREPLRRGSRGRLVELAVPPAGALQPHEAMFTFNEMVMVHRIPRDGDSLFASLSLQVQRVSPGSSAHQHFTTSMRHQTAFYIRRNWEFFFKPLLRALSVHGDRRSHSEQSLRLRAGSCSIPPNHTSCQLQPCDYCTAAYLMRPLSVHGDSKPVAGTVCTRRQVDRRSHSEQSLCLRDGSCSSAANTCCQVMSCNLFTADKLLRPLSVHGDRRSHSEKSLGLRAGSCSCAAHHTCCQLMCCNFCTALYLLRPRSVYEDRSVGALKVNSHSVCELDNAVVKPTTHTVRYCLVTTALYRTCCLPLSVHGDSLPATATECTRRQIDRRSHCEQSLCLRAGSCSNTAHHTCCKLQPCVYCTATYLLRALSLHGDSLPAAGNMCSRRQVGRGSHNEQSLCLRAGSCSSAATTHVVSALIVNSRSVCELDHAVVKPISHAVSYCLVTNALQPNCRGHCAYTETGALRENRRSVDELDHAVVQPTTHAVSYCLVTTALHPTFYLPLSVHGDRRQVDRRSLSEQSLCLRAGSCSSEAHLSCCQLLPCDYCTAGYLLRSICVHGDRRRQTAWDDVIAHAWQPCVPASPDVALRRCEAQHNYTVCYRYSGSDVERVWSYIGDLASPGFPAGVQVVPAVAYVYDVDVMMYPEDGATHLVSTAPHPCLQAGIAHRLVWEGDGRLRDYFDVVVSVHPKTSPMPPGLWVSP